MSTGKESVVQTPLMKQYYAIKEKHPDAILLFRVGDFYETFSDDAVKTSEIVGITLTRRANGAASFVELAGFPHHALDTYLPKLVRAGQRVAICDQLEDPKLTKGIVKRGITELVTPGVTTNDNILNHKENNFVASVHFDKKGAGVSFLDLSTGEFLASEGSISYIDKLLSNFKPKEVLFEKSKRREFEEHFGSRYYTFGLEDWVYNFSSANDRLLKHFETVSLKGFGITNEQFAVVAAGAILYYLDLTQHQHIKHITKLSPISENSFVWLDKFTIRNLELFGSSNEGARSLSDILDWTNTAMGSRMLKRWISLPLNDVKQITDRNEVVKYLIENEATKEDIETNLKKIGDLER
ncbi:MAG: DNA mismatch repair protein MutS, partial [Breznakibacter sp.]|nr:DNA mismatch repair protein MutS [Breznakibacter sp.]